METDLWSDPHHGFMAEMFLLSCFGWFLLSAQFSVIVQEGISLSLSPSLRLSVFLSLSLVLVGPRTFHRSDVSGFVLWRKSGGILTKLCTYLLLCLFLFLRQTFIYFL